MLDIIVIGREGFKSTDKPQVIYCGDSRSEARSAIAETGDRFPWVYEVNGMITRNYKTKRKASAPPEAAQTESVQTESPKKKKSK